MNRVIITFLIIAVLFLAVFSVVLVHGSRCVYIAVENQSDAELYEVSVQYDCTFPPETPGWMNYAVSMGKGGEPEGLGGAKRVVAKLSPGQLPDPLPEDVLIQVKIQMTPADGGGSLTVSELVTIPQQLGKCSVVTVTGGEEQGCSAEFSRMERINLLTILGIGG